MSEEPFVPDKMREQEHSQRPHGRNHRRRGGRPGHLPILLPLALLGGARMMRGGGGRRGPGGPHGPFGHGGPPPFMRRMGEGPFGFGGPFGHGPRARRGDVRTGILALLNEEPRNGYQIMQELRQRSGGAWRPSSGAIYPALQQLEDEGLVRTTETDGKRTYELTDAGRASVADQDSPAPWQAMADETDSTAVEMNLLFKQVAMAVQQVMQIGNEAQINAANTLLINTRRALYRLLAEDDDTTSKQD